MEKEYKFYIECDCGCDILKIIKWDDNPQDYLSLCIYKSVSMGIFQRVKQAFRYLRFGEFAYNDMMVKKKDIKRLINFLEKIK